MSIRLGASLGWVAIALGALIAASCGLSRIGAGDTLDVTDAAGPDGMAVMLGDGAVATGDASGEADASTAGDADDGASGPADSGIGCAVGATPLGLCDNFDNPTTGWASFWTSVNTANGVLKSDTTNSVTPPRSLYGAAPAATLDGEQVGLTAQVTFGKTVTVDFDYNASVGSPASYVEIVQLMVGGGGVDDGRFLVSGGNTTAYLNGYGGDQRQGVSTGTVTTGDGWHHARVVFVFATSNGYASLQIDHGAVLPSNMGNTMPVPTPAHFDVHVGSGPGPSQPPSRVNVDNLVLTVAP